MTDEAYYDIQRVFTMNDILLKEADNAKVLRSIYETLYVAIRSNAKLTINKDEGFIRINGLPISAYIKNNKQGT